jgi:hypothetical protein
MNLQFFIVDILFMCNSIFIMLSTVSSSIQDAKSFLLEDNIIKVLDLIYQYKITQI